MNVVIIAATTADGFIGKDSDHMADWTSKEDKQLFVKLTKEAGVMIMGSKTFDTIGRPLPGRKTVVYTKHPEKYADIDVTTTDDTPKNIIEQLSKEGFTSVAICGGGQVYDLFLKSGLVTDLYLTIEPITFGEGIPLFAPGTEIDLKLETSEKINEKTVALHYTVGQ